MIYEIGKNIMSIFSSEESNAKDKKPEGGVAIIVDQSNSCDGTWEITYNKNLWSEELEFICRPFVRISEPKKNEDKKNE